jgi:hypothetical protein
LEAGRRTGCTRNNRARDELLTCYSTQCIFNVPVRTRFEGPGDQVSEDLRYYYFDVRKRNRPRKDNLHWAATEEQFGVRRPVAAFDLDGGGETGL